MVGTKFDSSNKHDGVYDDDGRSSTPPSADPPHAQTGISPEETAQMERNASQGNAEGTDRQEGFFKPKDSQAQDSGNTAPGDNAGDSGWKQRAKNLLVKNRKKALIGGGAAGGIIGVSAFLLTIATGPFQSIHSAQVLHGIHFGAQDDLSDNLTSKFLLYAVAGKAAKGRLGVVQNTYADRWERRLNNQSGLKSVYSPTTQRLIGYQIVDAERAKPLVEQLKTDGIKTTGSLDGKDINGNKITTDGDFVDLQDEKHATRRSVTRIITKSTNLRWVSSTLGSRMLIKRAGVNFHPMKNVIRNKTDSIAKYNEERRAEKARQLETGSVDGKPSPSAERRKKINAQLRSALNSAKGPLLAVMTTCAVKSFSDGIDSQNFENQQQLKRVAMDVQAMGAQVQSGDGFNAEELGAYAALNYDPKTGTSLLDDPHIKQEIGEPATGKSYVEDVMPGSKEKPGFFKAADKIPVVGGICTLIQEGAELPVIKQALQLSESGMNATFRLVGLSTPDEYVKRAQKYFTTGGVNLAAQGAERGGLVNIGTRMAVGDQMIAMAGRELTPAEERQVQAEAKEYQQGTFAQSSFYERYANIYNHQSVASGVLRHTPTTRSEAVASLTQLPRFAFSQTIKVFGLATVGAAEPKRYEYSFPMFGFSSAEKNDPLYENPYELEEYMLEGDRLTRMNTEYGQSCFGVTVAPDGKITYGESLDITKIADKCKDPSNTELVRYRFYIAYIITSHGMSCSEGAEDACQQLSGSAPAQNLSVPPGEVVDAFLPSDSIPCPPGTDDAGVHDGYREGNPIKIRLCGIPGLPSSSSESTAGTSFYIPGSKGNALVNSRIAANILKLVQDATAAGIPMRAASSFRTMAHQQSLCPCGNGRVAKPGFSNHQTGLALDFDLADGKSLSVDSYTTANGQPDGPNNPRVAPSSPVYKWLVQNASKYGLKQYYKEPWHWSVDGS